MQPPINPNALTAMRLPLAPLTVVFMVQGDTWALVVAALLALFLELTDLADGYVARRYGAVTTFGKLFDPFSDAFCRYTLFLGMYAIDVADLWMIMVIFYRDSSISFIRSVAAIRSVVVSARPSGKLKAVVQGVGTQVIFIALVLSAILPDQAWLTPVPWWTMVIITAVTAASFVDYLWGNLDLLADAWSERGSGIPQ
ncbi:MAG: CDP-diacylglycerol--glycerol-3-phosphate 3-phosphatidyltransferase [Myxococcota bacterium]|jgi:CDP-diacylglycerol--glycerol-3-phosphate 3-phosphatidyltransferase